MNQADKLILEQLEGINPHSRTCKMCGESFQIDTIDLKFYKKFVVPCPTLCPVCRFKRRGSFRNERFLYKRKCDAQGKDIISIYSPDKPYKVYEQGYWWSDNWEATEFGMEYDSDKSFFEQMNELFMKVPKSSLFAGGKTDENSQYTNHAGFDRNCYMIFNVAYCEDCYYSHTLVKCKNCFDCNWLENSEYCYQVSTGNNCYKVLYSKNVNNCSESYFLSNCVGCKNCIGCVNLNNKEYYIFNEKSTKEEYEKFVSQMSSYEQILNFSDKFYNHFISKYPVKYAEISNSNNSQGDYIKNCNNCDNAFDCLDSENCKNVYDGRKNKDCMDIYSTWETEIGYETISSGCTGNRMFFSSRIGMAVVDVYYSFELYNCKNCFGCAGLRHKEYCILNKQYSKEEYEVLVEKIKLDMLQRGEYGEFFPISMSPFGYNESIANEHYPFEKQVALDQGFKWSEYNAENNIFFKDHVLQDDINFYMLEQNSKELLLQVLKCETTGKPYKILASELAFYLQMKIPLPRNCFDERHIQRMKIRNGMKIWDRQCMKCGTDIKTSYSPERTEKVYCETCYQKEVY